MAGQSAAAVSRSARARYPRLEADAIGVTQDVVIGMASSAPAATIGLSLAALAAATAYGSGPILILTAIPMLIIANAYRRCNMWNANCGASFEWVGRAISPYLGFLTGWLMVVAYIVGTVAEILLLGPSILAVFGSTAANAWAGIAIGTAVCLVMLVIAVIGIRITARTQVGMALVEYLILVGLSVRPAGGAQPPPRYLPHHEGLAQPQRDRRPGQRRGGLPDRGVRVRGLGRRPVRQRGSQAPEHKPGPGGHSGRRPARGHLHARAGGPAGPGIAVPAARSFGFRAGLRGAGGWAAVSGPR